MGNAKLASQLAEWRHELHRHPETAFEEKWTGDFLATHLKAMGIAVTRDIGQTGLVGTLKCGNSAKAIGLRSDIDANPIEEQGTSGWKSQNPGKMHACGHDGHMAQLLGAAKLLAESRDFDGTVYFIFQPAEEPGHGAQAMIKDGLFERFPMQEIYGLHNMPNIKAGHVHVRAGGIMASEDNFTIKIHGKGAHASSPHMAIDPLVTAAEVILALQTIPSRTANPLTPVVVSCTELYTDGAHNAIPSNVEIRGDTRSYSPAVQDMIEQRMREISEKTGAMNGAGVEFSYTHEFPPTVNSREQAGYVAEIAQQVVGADNVDGNCEPVMISEDFAHYLAQVPGAYFFLGSGAKEPLTDNLMLHHPKFNYNDTILEAGAELWAAIARARLN